MVNKEKYEEKIKGIGEKILYNVGLVLGKSCKLIIKGFEDGKKESSSEKMKNERTKNEKTKKENE